MFCIQRIQKTNAQFLIWRTWSLSLSPSLAKPFCQSEQISNCLHDSFVGPPFIVCLETSQRTCWQARQQEKKFNTSSHTTSIVFSDKNMIYTIVKGPIKEACITNVSYLSKLWWNWRRNIRRSKKTTANAANWMLNMKWIKVDQQQLNKEKEFCDSFNETKAKKKHYCAKQESSFVDWNTPKQLFQHNPNTSVQRKTFHVFPTFYLLKEKISLGL